MIETQVHSATALNLRLFFIQQSYERLRFYSDKRNPPG